LPIIWSIAILYRWIYSHTGESLHELLERELGVMVGAPAGFRDCYLGQ
jgi:hypothetical protein